MSTDTHLLHRNVHNYTITKICIFLQYIGTVNILLLNNNMYKCNVYTKNIFFYINKCNKEKWTLRVKRG